MKSVFPIVAAVDEADRRLAQLREARKKVDAARVLHLRLQQELRRLEQSPKRNQLAIERFRIELAHARTALRDASRELIKSL